jgi:hypothetical protein
MASLMAKKHEAPRKKGGSPTYGVNISQTATALDE